MSKSEKNLAYEPNCFVDYAFKRIGGKYKGRILWALHNHTTLRYGELGRVIRDATPKMLTQTLRELEEDKLIHREVYHEVPPKVEYSLTATGSELVPFIIHLRNWAAKHVKKENVAEPTTATCYK